jgi:hypothetical protein
MWAIDFGINHPFAAVLGAIDLDADIIHILHAIKLKDQFPLQHAAAMLPVGANVPVAWPQDGHQRSKHGDSGDASLAAIYKRHKLRMLADHATWPDGGNSTEAGIMEMNERFATGRLKVASHLSEWFEEFRLYHRKDGVLVKVNDDLMSATRVWVMARRFAKLVPLGGTAFKRRNDGVAKGVDFDVFG